ncbi:MAG: XdhC family protein, partial [Gemmatimonadales bacterium]
MRERVELWRAAETLAREGVVGALATVSRHRGSLPMAQDAKMLVTEDGRRWGTVGGGCVEADVTDQAIAAARAGRPHIVRHTLNADEAGDIGLSCGGTVELFLEPLAHAPEMAALYGAVAEAIVGRKAGTVYTGLDWSRGARKLAVLGDETIGVGGGWVATGGERGSNAAEGSRARRGTASLDEEIGAFVEPIERVPRVIVFGAGHVGAEIARLAARAGFHVLITDDRAEFADARRVPEAHEVVVDDFRSVLDRMELDEDDYVLATTRGHSYDAQIIERTAASPARYVGMLGSRRKREV